jgi:hypothetical protein
MIACHSTQRLLASGCCRTSRFRQFDPTEQLGLVCRTDHSRLVGATGYKTGPCFHTTIRHVAIDTWIACAASASNCDRIGGEHFGVSPQQATLSGDPSP